MLKSDDLINKVKTYNKFLNPETLSKAYKFAVKAHADQKRHSGDPYVIHPLAVADILTELKLDSATIATGLLLLDLHLGIFDAVLLLTIAALLAYQLVKYELDQKKDPQETPKKSAEPKLKKVSFPKATTYLIVGLLILIVSAEALVQAASDIAELLGVSTGIIGLTIVALGTSLPELAASITSILKNQDELAIGNIVGSNILNLLTVLPFPGLLAPGPFSASLLYRDFSVVTILTILLCFFCYQSINRKTPIGRRSGIIFLLIYCGWFTVMLMNIQS